MIVDLDDEATWPEGIRRYVGHQSRHVGGTVRHASDLRPYSTDGDTFLDLLDGRPIRLYHCTRLLPHELEWVQGEGLHPLTEALVRRRIDGARERDLINPVLQAALLRENVFAAGTSDGRQDQVCLIAGTAVFREDPHAAAPLLEAWGGEAIYRRAENGLGAAAMRLGTPTIISAAVDPGGAPRPRCFPGLPEVFIGRHMDMTGTGADVFLPRGVPAVDILDVWQPGGAATTNTVTFRLNRSRGARVCGWAQLELPRESGGTLHHVRYQRPPRVALQMPVPRSVLPVGEVVSRPILGGLHHAYARAA
jgi:hypothetical protein